MSITDDFIKSLMKKSNQKPDTPLFLLKDFPEVQEKMKELTELKREFKQRCEDIENEVKEKHTELWSKVTDLLIEKGYIDSKDADLTVKDGVMYLVEPEDEDKPE